MTDSDWEAIRSHTAVTYFLSPPIPQDAAREISGAALQLVAALLGAGGVDAKGESAGIAHGRARWLELASQHAQAIEEHDDFAAGASLYQAWVRRPLLDASNILYSCGMHLLGERDMEIESMPDTDGVSWLDFLGLYLAAERPARPVLDGEGLRSADGERRILRLRSCDRYETDDFFYNPYGYILLEPAEAE